MSTDRYSLSVQARKCFLLLGLAGDARVRTSNFLLFETDLMGEMGTVSIDPGVEQTAYGLFSDLVDIARSV